MKLHFRPIAGLILWTSTLLIAGCGGTEQDQPLRVGVFLYSQHPVIAEIYDGFREELNERSPDGVAVEYVERNADGDAAQASAVARYFRTAALDLLFVVGLPAAQALKSAGVPHPVVFGGPPDPVAAGLVPRLQNHGTNFTGTRFFPPTDMILETFAAGFPEADEVGVLHNPGEANSVPVARAFLADASARDIRTRDLGATNASEIEAALRSLAARPVDGLFLPTDNLIYTHLDRIITTATRLGIPVFSVTRLAVERGAVFSLGTDYHAVGRLSADVASRILFEGLDPGEVDVLDIRQGDLYVNVSHPAAARLRAPTGYERREIQ